MYSWALVPVPCLLVPMVIGELYMPPVDKCTIYACCSGPCSCAKVTYHSYLCLYFLCSHFYHSSVGYCNPPLSSHPHDAYGPCEFLTRVLYHITPCGPIWPVVGLTSLGQRGVVAQEKWSCGRPKSYLAYGLVLLALPVIWSVDHPSSPW